MNTSNIDSAPVSKTPSRNDAATMLPCPVCGGLFEPGGRRRYCSDVCRQAAWRRRRTPPAPPVPLPAPGRKRATTVYECDSCGSRALGVQRCDDCNMWMRAVGVGGLCPCCDEPVAVRDLVET